MSAICPRFTQNAWKKDLCSNCFKSKDEHKIPIPTVPIITKTIEKSNKTTHQQQQKQQDISEQNKNCNNNENIIKRESPPAPPPKSIIKTMYHKKSKKSQSVSFPEELSKIIGYGGGDWSDVDETSEDDENLKNNSKKTIKNSTDDVISSTDDDDEHQELVRITKTNTDFNMNNGNLLGDPEENIKKSFAALRLGRPQIDSSGKKQTLKISVTPFGTKSTKTSKISSIKTKLETSSKEKDNRRKFVKKDQTTKSNTNGERNKNSNKTNAEGNSSPPIERAMEKSLLEEISETLEKKQQQQNEDATTVKKIQPDKDGKIKFEITSFSATRLSPELKRTSIVTRKPVISNEKNKPSIINEFPKCSDSESNTSDTENSVSAYYDVIEMTDNKNAYENVPDGLNSEDKDETDHTVCHKDEEIKLKSIYSSSQYITDMLLSTKTHAASYSLHNSSFMTSKITSDGLIVTKCNSDDALDSTGSSFDGSSDEEMSYNMNRSESDSGIGISITNDYQTISEKDVKEKKSIVTKANSNNSDYEDIQVVDRNTPSLSKTEKLFTVEKSRELAGEPDGSADPDGNGEPAPALPKSPPPIASAEARLSFLHGMQKNITNNNYKKPEVPVKPTVSVIKTFAKRTPTNAEQQVITQLQQIITKQTSQPPESKDSENNLIKQDHYDMTKLLKKSKAPEPPPTSETTEEQTSSSAESKSETKSSQTQHSTFMTEIKAIETKQFVLESPTIVKTEQQQIQIQTNEISTSSSQQKIENEHVSIYTRNPAIGIKSNSPVIREKDKRERATINPKFRSLNTFSVNRRNQLTKPSTPEPSPRKALSVSEECLVDEKKKKSKFSIRKFLRMGGSNKTADHLNKKDTYSEEVAGDEPGVTGKPRLVIIHPLDINPTAVEVVKDIKTTQTVSVTNNVTTVSTTVNEITPSSSVVTGKPPAPPQRVNADRLSEINKPARPPPPKSAELRRRQKIGFEVNGTGSVKCKSDNVYANLGEIRSAIAPRKPERTASMREREAQLELSKKRQVNDNSTDTISISSSNGENNLNDTANSSQTSTLESLSNKHKDTLKLSVIEISPKDERFGTYERKKFFENESCNRITSKLEIFEKSSVSSMDSGKYRQSLNDGLKNSVLKINNTIDNYLKDKRDYEALCERDTSTTDSKKTYDAITTNRQSIRSSFQDTCSVSGISCTKSEYGGAHRYGVHNSLVNIPRIVSASYCGSEMGESDIYSPYSFYGSEIGDTTSDIHDGIWGVTTGTKSRVKTTNRLRMRKGRSVVHKNIEDNYSAVVVANHEALAQVLDQLQQSPVIPLALRPLANAINLRFEDFTILEDAQAFVVGKRAFHAALWTTTPVTLALSADCNAISGVGGELNQLSGGISGALNPITEFCDLVPSYHLPLMPSTEVRMYQATISVLPRMQLDTLQSIGIILKNKSQLLEKHKNNSFRGSIPNLSGNKEHNGNLRNVCSVQNLTTLNEETNTIKQKSEIIESNNNLSAITLPGMPSFDDVMCREVGFIMLQLVNGLKNLQSKAIEEMPLTLSNVILCKEYENKEAQARLCVLQGTNNEEDEPMGTLCKCAHIALTEMLPTTKLTKLLSDIFLQERSESLSKAKSILEFILWGPSDVVLDGTTKERELALQRWLDLERATVLHGLVRTRIELTIYDECHLMFLVRSNAKIMNEAAKIASNYEKNDKF